MRTIVDRFCMKIEKVSAPLLEVSRIYLKAAVNLITLLTCTTVHDNWKRWR